MASPRAHDQLDIWLIIETRPERGSSESAPPPRASRMMQPARSLSRRNPQNGPSPASSTHTHRSPKRSGRRCRLKVQLGPLVSSEWGLTCSAGPDPRPTPPLAPLEPSDRPAFRVGVDRGMGELVSPVAEPIPLESSPREARFASRRCVDGLVAFPGEGVFAFPLAEVRCSAEVGLRTGRGGPLSDGSLPYSTFDRG